MLFALSSNYIERAFDAGTTYATDAITSTLEVYRVFRNFVKSARSKRIQWTLDSLKAPFLMSTGQTNPPGARLLREERPERTYQPCQIMTTQEIIRHDPNAPQSRARVVASPISKARWFKI
jgi:hypothetical protein